jgi:hypothetical protein
MKKVILTIAVTLVVFLTIGNMSGTSEGGNSHTKIQRVLKDAIKSSAKHPDTINFKEYNFISVVGNTGRATYTFTSKNDFGMNMNGTATVTVVLNNDLTIKEYKNLKINE